MFEIVVLTYLTRHVISWLYSQNQSSKLTLVFTRWPAMVEEGVEVATEVVAAVVVEVGVVVEEEEVVIVVRTLPPWVVVVAGEILISLQLTKAVGMDGYG